MNLYRSLKDVVYDYLSDQIASGQLKPNESISESAICAALEISRTPVREALMQLSNEGYIEHIPRRGFFTRELTLERVANIYRIIGNLEGLAALQALENPGRLDLGEMRRLLDEMEAVLADRNYEAYHRLQYRFHEIFIQASRNENLIQILANLKKILVSREDQHRSDEKDSIALYGKMTEEHRRILELFEAGEGEKLQSFLRDEHWDVKYASYQTYVQ
jgi:DNA-binding GntR family transcriptional regulator